MGDVRPHNVFINMSGQVKVISTYSWPGQLSNYEKFIFQNEITYLSPEQINGLNLGQTDDKSQVDLSESFSVGLTCLDAALLADCSELYQKGNGVTLFARDLL